MVKTILCLLLLLSPITVLAQEIDVQRLATAIYWAEGGAKTNHPYGILKKYKHTTPRKACLNTIKNQKIRHANHNCGKDFLTCLRDRYCPIGCTNDNGTNRFWLANVKYFLQKG
jgi:hypothetical protein